MKQQLTLHSHSPLSLCEHSEFSNRLENNLINKYKIFFQTHICSGLACLAILLFEFVQLQLIFTRLTAGKTSFTPYIPLSFPTLTLTQNIGRVSQTGSDLPMKSGRFQSPTKEWFEFVKQQQIPHSHLPLSLCEQSEPLVSFLIL